MRDDALAVDVEFVLPGFAAENGMIFENEAFGSSASLANKKSGGREAADSPTDDNAIVKFAGLGCLFQERRGLRIAQFVACKGHFPSVAIAVCVVAHATVAVPILIRSGKRGIRLLREKLRRGKGMQKLCAGCKKRGTEKIAARNRRIHAGIFISGFICGLEGVLAHEFRLFPSVERVMAFFVELILQSEAGVIGLHGADSFLDGVNPGFHAGFT